MGRLFDTCANMPLLTRYLKLDICDLGQSFGINGLQLAMVSPSVWNSILGLSETSFSQIHPQRCNQSSFAPQDSHMQVDITHVALVSAMNQVREWITDISAVWTSEGPSNQELLSALCSHAVGRDLNSAIYWLFLRLGMPILTTKCSESLWMVLTGA
jgi:hypothetical protein